MQVPVSDIKSHTGQVRLISQDLQITLLSKGVDAAEAWSN